jgi:hypothetical protein
MSAKADYRFIAFSRITGNPLAHAAEEDDAKSLTIEAHQLDDASVEVLDCGLLGYRIWWSFLPLSRVRPMLTARR